MKKQIVFSTAGLSWPDNYYMEMDRDERKKLLEKAIEEEGRTEENLWRERLWESRYTAVDREPDGIDHFVRGYINLFYVAKSLKSVLRKKGNIKDMEQIRKDLCLDLQYEGSEIAEKVLYREYCHLIRLYLQLCMSDRSYSTTFMGLMSFNEDRMLDKMASDICKTAFVTPKRMGMEEVFEIFTQAALNVYKELFPKGEKILEEKIAEAKRNI